MKNQKNDELLPGMVELQLEEMKTIRGGESVSYWWGYLSGRIHDLFS